MLKVSTQNHLRFAAIGVAILMGALAKADVPTDLVQLALKSRDSLKASQKLVEAARRNASGNSASPTTRVEAGAGTRPDVTGGEDLTLFQPLDIFGKLRGARLSGRAGVRVAEAELRQTKLDIQTEVLTALANYSNAIASLRSAVQQLEIAKQLQKITKTKVEVRALPDLQNTRVSLEVQRAEQLVADREAAIRSSQIKLNQTAGNSVEKPEAADFLVISFPSGIPAQDRPELLLLSSQRAGYLGDAQTAKLSKLPDFELQARRTPWSAPEQYGVRFQFVVPLWDHGASANKTSAAQFQADASQLQYLDAAKRVTAEIEAANIQLEAARKSLDAYNSLLTTTKELMDKTQRGFELGAISLIDVLDAKRALSDAVEQRAAAQLAANLAVTEVLRAKGQILGEARP